MTMKSLPPGIVGGGVYLYNGRYSRDKFETKFQTYYWRYFAGKACDVLKVRHGFYEAVAKTLVMRKSVADERRIGGIMVSFLENKELVAMTIILLLASILCRFTVGIFLNSLIREAENMSTTQNRLLKKCKVKFRNCYKLNDGVPNISIFVDKFLSRLQIGRFSVDGISHLAGQLMLLSIVTAGLGACKGIIDGKSFGEIIPFYLMSFLGLYLYFSISGLVDLDGKRELLKVSLTDFLENHMAARLAVLEESEEAAGLAKAHEGRKSRIAQGSWEEEEVLQTGAAIKEETDGIREMEIGLEDADAGFVQERMEEQIFTRKQEKELEELLREFFA